MNFVFIYLSDTMPWLQRLLLLQLIDLFNIVLSQIRYFASLSSFSFVFALFDRLEEHGIFELFVDFFGTILKTINSIHWIDKYLDQGIHILFLTNNQIYFLISNLKCNTLPSIKWSLILNFTIILNIHLFSVEPKSGGDATEEDRLHLTQLTTLLWFRHLIFIWFI